LLSPSVSHHIAHHFLTFFSQKRKQTDSSHTTPTISNRQPKTIIMSITYQPKPMATAAAAPPSLLTQVGMAGTAAVITVRFLKMGR
jgi:hypothetical protein